MSERVPRELQYLIRYMESNYMQPLTLEFLSSFSGFSVPHLIRLFDRHFGKSPIDYCIDLRLSHAKLLLKDSDLSVSQIGKMVGIPGSSYFGALFKKRTGMSPGQYRKKIRQPVMNLKDVKDVDRDD